MWAYPSVTKMREATEVADFDTGPFQGTTTLEVYCTTCEARGRSVAGRVSTIRWWVRPWNHSAFEKC